MGLDRKRQSEAEPVKYKPMTDDFTNEEHLEMLNNKEADEFSTYVTYERNVEMFGVEYALKCMGLKKSPKNPAE